MYAQRGFGYYGTQSANSGRILVPMLSTGISPTTATVTNAPAIITLGSGPLLENIGLLTPHSDGSFTITKILTAGSRRVGWWQLD